MFNIKINNIILRHDVSRVLTIFISRFIYIPPVSAGKEYTNRLKGSRGGNVRVIVLLHALFVFASHFVTPCNVSIDYRCSYHFPLKRIKISKCYKLYKRTTRCVEVLSKYDIKYLHNHLQLELLKCCHNRFKNK